MIKFSKKLVKELVLEAIRAKNPNAKTRLSKSDVNDIVRKQVKTWHEENK